MSIRLSSTWRIILFGSACIAVAVFSAAMTWLVVNYQRPTGGISTGSEQAVMTGTVSVNGYTQPGSTASILARTDVQTEYQAIVQGLGFTTQDTPWSWAGAESGTLYRLKAIVYDVQGNEVAHSADSFAAAPGSNIFLSVVSSLTPPQPATVSLSGTVDVQGYIPQGSSVQVIGALAGSDSGLTPLQRNITPSDGTAWQWNNARAGATYQLQAILVSSAGATIATGSLLTVVAPAADEQLTLVSTLTPPTTPTPQPAQVTSTPIPIQSGLTGSITLNGNIPSGSYLTLGVRPTGKGQFSQVASNLSATSGVVWSWYGAQSGVSYDIQAYLWVNNQPYAQSQILTATSPSSGDSLTINAAPPLPQPQYSSLNVTCNQQQSNVFQAKINFNQQGNLPNPQSYQIIVTSASQGTQLLNTVVAPGNAIQPQSLTTTFLFTPGATYYAQYAYAQCTGCSTFSQLSPSVAFSCQ